MPLKQILQYIIFTFYPCIYAVYFLTSFSFQKYSSLLCLFYVYVLCLCFEKVQSAAKTKEILKTLQQKGFYFFYFKKFNLDKKKALRRKPALPQCFRRPCILYFLSTQAIVQGHGDGEMWGLAVHPTHDVFATSSDDTSVRVWDAATKV